MVEQINNLVALIESQLEGPGEERMGEDIGSLELGAVVSVEDESPRTLLYMMVLVKHGIQVVRCPKYSDALRRIATDV